jgi:chorismate dehydratase
MMAPVRVAAVSYLNTIPFLYGLRRSDSAPGVDLLLSPPAGCADAIACGHADIALIPIAEIPAIDNIRIIGNHCIGARDTVRTVALMSSSPLEEITKIYLDPHSRTSVALVKVLAREHWGIDPEWLPLKSFDGVKPEKGVGYTLIGDKVFGYEAMFPYNYDLAHEWHEFTGLPFVFAAWVARPNVSEGEVEALGKALEYGVRHIADAAREDGRVDYETAVKYLTENIDFSFDAEKRKSLEVFLRKHRENAAKINPG